MLNNLCGWCELICNLNIFHNMYSYKCVLHSANCNISDIPVTIDEKMDNFTKKIDDYVDQKYYNCK